MTSPESSDPGLVIVGGGTAAHACVKAYREHGGSGPVDIVSDDDRAPYFRPSLTKELITGEQGWDDLPLEDDDWWRQHAAVLHLQTTATGFDANDRVVFTDDGPLDYSTLVLATGSSAGSLPVPGGDDPHILRVRRASDAARLLDELADGDDVLIIGSGFIGCEIAASLRIRSAAQAVSLATMESAPQTDRLGDQIGSIVGGWLDSHGVSVHGGVQLSALERAADSIVSTFDGGLCLEARHVIMATGARPNLDLAKAAGLDTRAGVPTDASMRTALDGVLAAGDIVHAHHPIAGRRLRVEHWGDAERMGAVAGSVAAGDEDEWRDVPGFWSVIGGRELKYVAWGDGYDQCKVECSDDGGFTAWYGTDGAICGVLTYLHDEDNEAAARLITSGASMPGG